MHTKTGAFRDTPSPTSKRLAEIISANIGVGVRKTFLCFPYLKARLIEEQDISPETSPMAPLGREERRGFAVCGGRSVGRSRFLRRILLEQRDKRPRPQWRHLRTESLPSHPIPLLQFQEIPEENERTESERFGGDISKEPRGNEGRGREGHHRRKAIPIIRPHVNKTNSYLRLIWSPSHC